MPRVGVGRLILTQRSEAMRTWKVAWCQLCIVMARSTMLLSQNQKPRPLAPLQKRLQKRLRALDPCLALSTLGWMLRRRGVSLTGLLMKGCGTCPIEHGGRGHAALALVIMTHKLCSCQGLMYMYVC